MALSFEEWKLRKEYEAYLAEEAKKEDPKKEDLKKEDPKKEDPKEDPKKEDPKEDPKKEDPKKEDSYANELKEIKAQLAIMSKALSPSLGNIKPVGIEDVVSYFFDIKTEDKKED